MAQVYLAEPIQASCYMPEVLRIDVECTIPNIPTYLTFDEVLTAVRFREPLYTAQTSEYFVYSPETVLSCTPNFPLVTLSSEFDWLLYLYETNRTILIDGGDYLVLSTGEEIAYA